MKQSTKIQNAAVKLVSKYFGQSTAEIYNGFFNDESDDIIVDSLSKIMVEYLGEKKAKEEINKFMGHLAL